MTVCSYVLVSRGSQGDGARVIDTRTGAVKVFSSRAAARAYAREITPEMPSKYLPIVARKEGL